MATPGLTATWGAEAFAKFVLDHLSAQSVLLASGARRINITGKSAHVPRLLSDGNAAWTAEAAEIDSSSPDADEVVLSPKALKSICALSNESIGDAEVDVLDAVGVAMTRSISTKLDLTVFDAAVATSLRPAGLRSAAYTLPGVAATVANAAGIDAIRVGIGTIAAAGGRATAIYMAAADFTTLSNLKEGTTGSIRPLLQPDVTQANAYTIGGARIWITPGMPAGTCLIADASQILLGVRKDATVDFSSHQRFSADSVVARVVARFDWAISDAAGLVPDRLVMAVLMPRYKAKIDVVHGGLAHAAGTRFSANEQQMVEAVARGWVEPVTLPKSKA
jgi:HK97 family phage major capsid protein